MQVPFMFMSIGQFGSINFGEKTHHVLGILLILILINEYYFLNLSTAVVDLDFPLLLGLYVLQKFRMMIEEASQNKLLPVYEQWTILLVNKFGHIYLELFDY